MAARTRLRLYRADLRYEPDIRVYTAVSAALDTLHELFLEVEADDGFYGIGEVRANIAFLTGIDEDAVAGLVRQLIDDLDWTRPPEALVEDLSGAAGRHPALARAAVESALIDGMARAQAVPVAALLGGPWLDAVETSNCLFWCPDDVFDRLARRYVDEGFRHLKVRVAIEDDFGRDLARLRRLRERYGDRLTLAVDANGAWPLDLAIERLRALEPLNPAYVEQPTPVGDWKAFRLAGERTRIPLMADESLRSPADLDELARIGPPSLAHLKIAKAGGPRSLAAQARRLRDAGVELMVGQMNEGAMATALAAHCAMALTPAFRELYGCYGLLDDVSSGPTFADGHIHLPGTPGTGVEFEAERAKCLWQADKW